ncbi:hypothetical protein MMC29_008488, partial [Sticta canariensis]|nr:hypothetical protein [Sticta canariensis]
MPPLLERPCQNASAAPSANELRRIVPVVPVIPRKLEKKRGNTQAGEVSSTTVENVTGLSRQSSASVKTENGKSERKSSFVAEEDK